MSESRGGRRVPDLRDLRAFVAVAEHLSFTRAAEQLHLTQQTVSRTIRDLERQLGVDLLERTSREVRLAPAGAALLAPGRETLAQAAAAFEAARAVGDGRSGLIRVGVTPAVGPQDRADVVRVLRRGSNRSVNLRDLRPSELRPSLRDHAVDVVLACVSGTSGDSFDRAELRPTRMDIHVLASHRLAAAGVARLQDFDGERLLTANATGTPYTDLLIGRFTAAGARVTPVEARVTGGAQLLTELDGMDAIAAMPAGTQSPAGVRRVGIAGFTMPLLLLWPAGRPSPAVAQLREQLGKRPRSETPP